MGRYTGPVEKLSRREGVELYLKGERLAAGKAALERRPYPPGQHGRARRRQSQHRRQLRKKQRAKSYYGVRERQFRPYFERARRQSGVGRRESAAPPRAPARQRRLQTRVRDHARPGTPVPVEVRPGDVITLRPGAAVEPAVRRATELTSTVPGWLIADHDGLSGRAERLPEREDIPVPVNEQLIVELYSR